ncbi:MAG: hypothetical protein ACOX9R_01800 [Armatimonadota bacterium]|jgi:hypothetical protein
MSGRDSARVRERAAGAFAGFFDGDPAALLVLTLVAMYALLVLAPLVPGIDPTAGAVIVTVLFTLGALAAAMLTARMGLSPWVQAGGLLLGIINWFLYATAGMSGPLSRLTAVPAADIFLVFAMILGGLLLSRIVRERTMIVPVAIVLALADVFTVYLGGPTGAALEKMPELVEAVSVKLPAVGSAAGPEGLEGLAHIATLGPGDTFFAALFFAAVIRFGLSVRRTFGWLFGVTGVALGLFVAVPAMPPVPVLPLMAAGFLIANWHDVKLSKREWAYMAVAFGFLIVLFAGLRYLVQAAL